MMASQNVNKAHAFSPFHIYTNMLLKNTDKEVTYFKFIYYFILSQFWKSTNKLAVTNFNRYLNETSFGTTFL